MKKYLKLSIEKIKKTKINLNIIMFYTKIKKIFTKFF